MSHPEAREVLAAKALNKGDTPDYWMADLVLEMLEREGFFVGKLVQRKAQPLVIEED